MPPIWYSLANVDPDVRDIATQLNVVFVADVGGGPVSASSSVFHRLGATPVVGVQLQVIVPAVSAQLHALSASCVLASIMRSIEPELSMRSITFGSGGLVSICWARAIDGAAASATHADAASSDRASRLSIVVLSPHFRALDGGRR